MNAGPRRILPSLLILSLALLGCDAGPPANVNEKPKPIEPGPVDKDAPEEFTTTESGLKYRIRRASGGKKPTADQMVTVHYRGWIDDGTIFDTTYGTGGAPRSFELKHYLPGWSEGMQLIGEGGMIELQIPSKLAFGSHGLAPLVAPDATVHFLIELIKVSDPPRVAPELELPSGGLQPGPVDPDAPEEFTTTKTGLKYRIRRKSTGKQPAASSTVTVHYRGWLEDGDVFDSSYTRNTPAVFGLGDVISGWTEGLQLVGVGGMIELEIPSNLGYGDAGKPPQIPPKSTLHFLIELLDVK